ncbi:MAG: Gfo/Idh/MocA family oxidoreductase, partial [Chloroflexota bacterium]|nr:Gfo/Idh/MocA family oxidoreductase [Chloroflexota bacterium]
LHRDATVTALEAGTAVLCEKPMATSVADCEAMIAAADRTGKLLSVGFCHRFQPHIERLRELAQGGTLGTILMFRNRFAGHLPGVENTWFSKRAVAGGGVMFDTAVHSVDLFRFLVGEPERVDAVAATSTTQLGPALDVEDTAIMLLRSRSGVLGVIETSWRTPPGEWSVTLYGTGGSATVTYDPEELRVRLATERDWRRQDVEPGNRFIRELTHFLDCVRTGSPPRVTAADGLAATTILTEAYRSSGFA